MSSMLERIADFLEKVVDIMIQIVHIVLGLIVLAMVAWLGVIMYLIVTKGTL